MAPSGSPAADDWSLCHVGVTQNGSSPRPVSLGGLGRARSEDYGIVPVLGSAGAHGQNRPKVLR